MQNQQQQQPRSNYFTSYPNPLTTSQSSGNANIVNSMNETRNSFGFTQAASLVNSNQDVRRTSFVPSDSIQKMERDLAKLLVEQTQRAQREDLAVKERVKTETAEKLKRYDDLANEVAMLRQQQATAKDEEAKKRVSDQLAAKDQKIRELEECLTSSGKELLEDRRSLVATKAAEAFIAKNSGIIGKLDWLSETLALWMIWPFGLLLRLVKGTARSPWYVVKTFAKVSSARGADDKKRHPVVRGLRSVCCINRLCPRYGEEEAVPTTSTEVKRDIITDREDEIYSVILTLWWMIIIVISVWTLCFFIPAKVKSYEHDLVQLPANQLLAAQTMDTYAGCIGPSREFQYKAICTRHLFILSQYQENIAEIQERIGSMYENIIVTCSGARFLFGASRLQNSSVVERDNLFRQMHNAIRTNVRMDLPEYPVLIRVNTDNMSLLKKYSIHELEEMNGPWYCRTWYWTKWLLFVSIEGGYELFKLVWGTSGMVLTALFALGGSNFLVCRVMLSIIWKSPKTIFLPVLVVYLVVIGNIMWGQNEYMRKVNQMVVETPLQNQQMATYNMYANQYGYSGGVADVISQMVLSKISDPGASTSG